MTPAKSLPGIALHSVWEERTVAHSLAIISPGLIYSRTFIWGNHGTNSFRKCPAYAETYGTCFTSLRAPKGRWKVPYKQVPLFKGTTVRRTGANSASPTNYNDYVPITPHCQLGIFSVFVSIAEAYSRQRCNFGHVKCGNSLNRSTCMRKTAFMS